MGPVACQANASGSSQDWREPAENVVVFFRSSFKYQTNRTLNRSKLAAEITETVPGSKPEADDLEEKLIFPKNQPQRKESLKITNKNS